MVGVGDKQLAEFLEQPQTRRLGSFANASALARWLRPPLLSLREKRAGQEPVSGPCPETDTAISDYLTRRTTLPLRVLFKAESVAITTTR